METSPKEVTPTKARKRAAQPIKWKRNKAKASRYKATDMPIYPTCKPEKGSFRCQTLRMQDIQEFHAAYYATNNKKDQDAFIVKHTKAVSVARRRATNQKHKKKVYQIKCYVSNIHKDSIPVCHATFLNILGIKKTRMQLAVDFYFSKTGSPRERRGGDRKSSKNVPKIATIIKCLTSLKCIESHYCRGKTMKKYLPSELNITKLYRMFFNQNPANQTIRPWLFRNVFNRHFNLSFKAPQSDACSFCLEMKELIKRTAGSEKVRLMTQKRVHSLKAQAFYDLLRDNSEDIAILSFDCQKNQVLPKIPDQSVYYSRHIYFYDFTVVEGNSHSQMTPLNVYAYCCTEEQYKKDSNLIASAVFHRLKNMTFNDSVVRIRLVADGCRGQNKNTILIAMLTAWLIRRAPPHIKEIELVFPMVGHSFLPADRMFALTEKRVKAENVIPNPEKYVEILEKTATVFKFGEHCDVLDWRSEAADTFKAVGSWHFGFNSAKRFYIKRTSDGVNVKVRGECHYRTDLGQYKRVTKLGKTIRHINPDEISNNEVQLNPLKIRDVLKLLTKHYGENWREVPELNFFERFLPVGIEADYENVADEPISEDHDHFCSPNIEETQTLVV